MRRTRDERYVYADFRSIKKGEPGYRPKARHYISETTGQVITAHEYYKHAETVSNVVPAQLENPREQLHRIQEQARHHITVAHIEARANYYDKLNRFIDQKNKENSSLGISEKMSVSQARKSPEFKQLYYDLTKTKEKGPKSRKAQALVALGLRDEAADYDVGDTP